MKKETVIFGLHAVESVLIKQPFRVIQLLVLEGRRDQKIDKLVQSAKKQQLKLDTVPRAELDQLTHHQNHQGVAAVCAVMEQYTAADLPLLLDALRQPPFLLILDGIQDPHNLGACLRSADAAGVHMVIAPQDKSVGLTPTVCKVACGAAETVPFVQVTNLARTLTLLKERNIWLYGAAEEAEKNLYQTDLQGAIGIVLGAEGSGLRRLTRDHCDFLVKIPMHGFVSSLMYLLPPAFFYLRQ